MLIELVGNCRKKILFNNNVMQRTLFLKRARIEEISIQRNKSEQCAGKNSDRNE